LIRAYRDFESGDIALKASPDTPEPGGIRDFVLRCGAVPAAVRILVATPVAVYY